MQDGMRSICGALGDEDCLGLGQVGKPAKVALTACMRNLLTFLNALLKAKTPWRPSVECKP